MAIKRETILSWNLSLRKLMLRSVVQDAAPFCINQWLQGPASYTYCCNISWYQLRPTILVHHPPHLQHSPINQPSPCHHFQIPLPLTFNLILGSHGTRIRSFLALGTWCSTNHFWSDLRTFFGESYSCERNHLQNSTQFFMILPFWVATFEHLRLLISDFARKTLILS